ncbi:hypothetical protein ACI48D_12275 [Massilia sp. LXY-6]|uniref:hypothetical protein n=1 Tax=Massilia sp. LXY-6 TaxID=3379823 RepID=UPI003EDFE4BF
MKPTLRLLLVCFLMLALPFQAFASASMRPPVAHAITHVATPGQEAPAAQLPPCHQQMAMAAAAAKSTHSAHSAPENHAGQHAKGKCGTCTACCVGAAMAPGLPAALALAAPATSSIPFRAGHLPSVDPVLPERPPSTLLA